MENNGENSGPLTSLPVDRLTATDCNADRSCQYTLLSFCVFGMRRKAIFSKTEIFWPKKDYLMHLKGFKAYFIDEGYVLDIHIRYQLSKVNLAKLVAFL